MLLRSLKDVEVVVRGKTCLLIFFYAPRARRPNLHAPYFYVPCTLAPCSASAMRMLTPWAGPHPPKPHPQGPPRDPQGGRGPSGPLGPFGAQGGPLIRNESYSEWNRFTEKTFVRII